MIYRRLGSSSYRQLISFGLACMLFLCGPAAAAGELDRLKADAETRTGVAIFIPSGRLLYGWRSDSLRFAPLSLGDGRGGDAADVERYLRMYGEEFAKYPPSFLQQVRLEWVAFVKELNVNGEPRGATYQRFHWGMAHTPGGGLVYDVRVGRYDEPLIRWNLHHEFFHFVDAFDFYRADAAAWPALNAPGFRYNGIRRPRREAFEHPSPGLLTDYAQKSVAEDRAELFAALMTDEARPRLLEIVESDPIVRRKFRSLVSFLSRLDPAMGERYFERRLGAVWRAIEKP